MSSQPTYSDFRDGRPAELMKTYKLDQRGLEKAQRSHLYGASQAEMRKEYERFYIRNRRDA